VKTYLNRYRFVALVIALLFGVLAAQLFNLQIVGYEENQASADSKKTKTITSQVNRIRTCCNSSVKSFGITCGG